MAESHVSSEITASDTSLMVFAFGLVPLFWAPVSDVYGRKWVILAASPVLDTKELLQYLRPRVTPISCWCPSTPHLCMLCQNKPSVSVDLECSRDLPQGFCMPIWKVSSLPIRRSAAEALQRAVSPFSLSWLALCLGPPPISTTTSSTSRIAWPTGTSLFLRLGWRPCSLVALPSPEQCFCLAVIFF